MDKGKFSINAVWQHAVKDVPTGQTADGMGKTMEKIRYQNIENEDVLEFAVFCIESVAEKLGGNPADVYQEFAGKNNILNGYIVPCYEALHTQSKEYIVSELLAILKERQAAG